MTDITFNAETFNPISHKSSQRYLSQTIFCNCLS